MGLNRNLTKKNKGFKPDVANGGGDKEECGKIDGALIRAWQTEVKLNKRGKINRALIRMWQTKMGLNKSMAKETGSWKDNLIRSYII